jgi:thiol-disulfide isomerase/thioredoxin
MRNPKVIAGIFVVAVISVAAALFGQDSPADKGVKTPEKLASAPDWQLQNLDGKTVHFSDFKGKVVIVDFWATWCGPCRQEIPGFIELQKRYEKQGLEVVGVSVDQVGPTEVKKLAQQIGVNYPIVLADTKTTQAFGGIKAIPTTFVIDREGHIVGQHLGLTAKEEFEKEIKPLLNP